MKIKTCPKCGGSLIGERWAKGRKLEQYCRAGHDDEVENDNYCGWVGEPYTPPKRRITNTTQVRIDEFSGWHYILYDKYGHVNVDSATYATKAEAMKELKNNLTPKEGYNDPAAPYTAVLFKVPSFITIEGTMFELEDGKVVEAAFRNPGWGMGSHDPA